MKKYCLFLILLCIQNSLVRIKAQIIDNESDLKNLVEELYDPESPEKMENFYEEISDREEHPFNIQTLTKEQLESLHLLSEIQIEDLITYLYYHRPIKSIYELKNIKSLDMISIRLLLPFVYLGKEEIPPISLKKMKNELIIRSDYCLQEKAGFSNSVNTKDPKKNYLGERPYLLIKYRTEYKDRYSLSIIGEKDEGEPFLTKTYKGFDFYSFSLSICNPGKILDKIILGDYKINMGEGLVVNNTFSLGKNNILNAYSSDKEVIKKSSSVNEFYFFRGAAFSFHLNTHFDLYFFLSRRDLDANADQKTIYSFKTDGYHRTVEERNKKSCARINLAGFNSHYNNKYFDFGTTFVCHDFGGKILDPKPREYNKYYLRGKYNFNFGINYAFTKKKFSIHGESSVSANGSLATLNTFEINLGSKIRTFLSYRNYNKSYNSLYSNALCESTEIRNEKGVLLGFKAKDILGCNMTIYADFFRFPYLKYAVDGSSSGKDLYGTIAKALKKGSVKFAYRLKRKEKNFTQNKKKSILPYYRHSFKLSLNDKIGTLLEDRISMNFNIYEKSQSATQGWALSNDLKSSPSDKISVDFSYSYFNCKNWDNVIYSYENSISRDISFIPLYGCGSRYYINIGWKIRKYISFYFKASDTVYYDKDKISSGTEEISGNKKRDINCSLKIKF